VKEVQRLEEEDYVARIIENVVLVKSIFHTRKNFNKNYRHMLPKVYPALSQTERV